MDIVTRVAFNTANLVGRVTGYRYKLERWGDQHQLTVASMNEREWESICGEIAAAGYRAVEVWLAHCDPSVTTPQKARRLRKILDAHALTPIGIAGSLNAGSARVCQWMGMPAVNGGFPKTSLAEVRALVAATGLCCNYENHPEKSAEELRSRIDGGDELIGLCIDTGWLGTQGLDAPGVIRTLGPLVRHVHLKDVKAPGAHETCPLGEGCVGIPAVIGALKEIRYQGWYSWEDEPEDRNPMKIAAAMRELIARALDA